MKNIKESIKEYYVRLDEVYKKYGMQLKVPFNPKVLSDIYVGSEDDEGYIVWRIIERTECINSEKLSGEIGFQIHSSLIEFINSYFFLEMSGSYREYEVSFDSIVPNTILSSFISRRCIPLKTNEEKIVLIQIGVINEEDNDNLLMCLVNSTGQIVCYDYDKKTIQVISESLNELISNLEPRC